MQNEAARAMTAPRGAVFVFHNAPGDRRAEPGAEFESCAFNCCPLARKFPGPGIMGAVWVVIRQGRIGQRWERLRGGRRRTASGRHPVSRLQRAARFLDRTSLFAEILLGPRRVLWLNFLAGLARGFGIAIGLTVVAAIFFSLLGRLAAMNLPIIGRFIAEIVRLVESQLRTLPR